MNREEVIRLLDAQIALLKAKLKALRLEEDLWYRMKFAAFFAMKFQLGTHWPECRHCERGHFLFPFCLESRLKTGKCPFDSDEK